MDVRTDVSPTDDFLRTKISWMHSLPNNLTHGAPLINKIMEMIVIMIMITIMIITMMMMTTMLIIMIIITIIIILMIIIILITILTMK